MVNLGGVTLKKYRVATGEDVYFLLSEFLTKKRKFNYN